MKLFMAVITAEDVVLPQEWVVERDTGMQMKTSPVPLHWFHSRPVPAGSSENVNHSRPAD